MRAVFSPRHQVFAASVAIVLGGALWGLFWVPIRALSGFALEGPWAGAVLYVATGAVLCPLLIARGRHLLRRWAPLAAAGLLTGAAFSFYSTSLLTTDVVRAIVLFYLTPVWGTLLGVAFLGERFTRRRLAALLLGVAGLLVMLGVGRETPLPRNLGDWMALASGLLWAAGSLQLYRMGSASASDQLLAFVFGSVAVTAATILLFGEAVAPTPALSDLAAAAPWALLVALYVAPMLFLTVWPATVLTPGRVGLLLMSDVVVGVASAAAFSGEPFGARELIATLFIVAAGVVEVTGPTETPPR